MAETTILDRRIDDELVGKLPLIRNAAQEQLLALQKTEFHPLEEGKNLIRRLIGRKLPPRDILFWPTGMLMLGIAEADREGLYTPIYFKSVLENFRQAGGKLYYPDDVLSGAGVLKAWGSGELSDDWEAVLHRMDEFLERTDRDEKGLIIYRPGRTNKEVIADGIGMSAFFLAQYAEAFGDAAALEDALAQLKGYRAAAKDPETGLLYHGYECDADAALQMKGLLGWGRAMGWMMLGISECAAASKDEELVRWLSQLGAFMKAHQKEDGLLPWTFTDRLGSGTVLTAAQRQTFDGSFTDGERHSDTSASAMIGYALLYGVSEGILPEEEYTEFFEKLTGGLLAVTDDKGNVGSSLAESAGFGLHPQNYTVNPWGQGAALSFLALADRQNEQG